MCNQNLIQPQIEVKKAGSKRFSINKADIKSILINFTHVSIGAGLTYLTDEITKANFGQFNSLILAGWFLISKTLQKYLTDNTEKPADNTADDQPK